MQNAEAQKLEFKLPAWSGYKILLPSSLALEQCSSSATASYKADLVRQWLGSNLDLICDICGGLGVDSSALSTVCKRLIYYESNPELVNAARQNFATLGLMNIECRCEQIGTQSEVETCSLIYADPSRRDSYGRKVHKIEDYSPDILSLAPRLMEKSPALMVKLSPMLDLSRLFSEFSAYLNEIHILGYKGEVKELLCLMSREVKERKIVAVELGTEGCSDSFSFSLEEEAGADFRPLSSIEAGQILVEPSAVMLKSGAFKLMSTRFGMKKLSKSTHLYLLDLDSKLPESLFRTFVIEEILPLNSASMKGISKLWPQAELSAKNIHIGSEELRKRLGCKSGGDIHIFGCTADCAGKLFLVCRSCNYSQLPR